MLIKNGRISTGSDTFFADVLIENEVISQIGENLSPEGRQVIDAKGLYVLPGGVDAHTHFDLDVGIARATDDFYTGSIAAACGGTTTIIDHMAFGPKGCGLKHQLNVYHALAEDKAVVDYGFHGVIQHVDDNILEEMSELVSLGVTSCKFYLTYDYKLEDEEAFRVLKKAKELGVIVTVHPENHGVITFLRGDFLKKGLVKPIYHAKSRPLECEAEAINRMVLMARMAGDAPLYIVHLSNGLGLGMVQQAREAGQKNLFVETCPQYMFLDESKYLEEGNEGLKYIMSPPLRPAENKEMLWSGVELGSVDVIATDHCPFFFHEHKMMGVDDFTKTPNGAPGVEARMALLYSEGVAKGRISINRFVEICSTNPAKIFGAYPKKGTIAVGADGDIILLNPDKKVKLTHERLHENVDYTPYEGMELCGAFEMTISRGEVIVQNNEFIGKKGRGKYLKRGISHELR